LDVRDSTGALLLACVPCWANTPLLRPFATTGLPAGDLLVLDVAGLGTEPTQDGFGTDFQVIYMDANAASVPAL
ncbi:MAG: phage baseplate plug family protein, partial [Terriglobales bacterium]